MEVDPEMVPLTDREALDAMEKAPMTRFPDFDEHYKRLEGLKSEIRANQPKRGATARAVSKEEAVRHSQLEREYGEAKAVTAACYSRSKLLEYMATKPAGVQDMAVVEGALNALAPFDLSMAELLQIVNLRPTNEALLFVIVEECAARLGEKQRERLLEVIKDKLPEPNGEEDEEDEEDDDEGGDGEDDDEEEEEVDDRGVDADAAAVTEEVAEENELQTQVVRAPRATAEEDE